MTLNKLNALRWYDNLADQERNRWFQYDRIYPLITPTTKLLPFQFRRAATNKPLTSFKLHELSTGTETEILTEIEAAGLSVYNNGLENYAYTGSTIQDPSIDNTRSWGFSIGAREKLRYIQVFVEKIAQVPPIAFADWVVRFVLYDSKDGTEIGSYDSEALDSTIGARELVADFGEIITTNGTDVLWLEIRSNQPFYLYGRDDAILDYTPEQERYGLSTSLDDAPDTNIGTAGDYDAHARCWGGVYDYDLIIYPGLLSYDYDTPLGRHYAIMSDADNTWYSEVFTFVSDITRYLKITYWHRYDFNYTVSSQNAMIRYLDTDGANMYKSIIYLDTSIGKPDYKTEDEFSERNSRRLKIYQVSWKELRFEYFSPEYLLDAMRIINMHHDIQITYNGETFVIDDFDISSFEWQQDGDIAKVEAICQVDTVVTQQGDNVLPLPASTPIGIWTQPDGGFWQTESGDGWLFG